MFKIIHLRLQAGMKNSFGDGLDYSGDLRGDLYELAFLVRCGFP